MQFSLKALNFMGMLFQRLSLLSKKLLFKQNSEEDVDEEEDRHRPSASMVPVPTGFMAESIKEQLPVVEYRKILESRECKDLAACVCVVCLNCVEASHEVRELYNCSHLFHRECLDVWIEQGQVTCPVCRLKLLHDQKEKAKNGGDPWRRERMIYLFGEDYEMGTF